MARDSRHRGDRRPAGGFWSPARAGVFLAVVAVVWLAADRLTKIHFDQYSLGEHIGGPYGGLFQFTLVHNTGAAWGIFSGSTFMLGLFSVALSIAGAVLVVEFARRSNWVFVLGGSLVVAGGIGNAVDRFALGYVVDFIRLSFIDFPVFNIADIGVTCGFALVIIAVMFFWRDGAPAAPASGEGKAE